MIKGIGIDIIELSRIRRSIERDHKLAKRILTQAETAVFEQLTSPHRKVEFLAGRFAVKEAFAKATGMGIGKLSFQHIEVLPSDTGAPMIDVVGFEAYNIFISISHSKEYAVAQAIIETK